MTQFDTQEPARDPRSSLVLGVSAARRYLIAAAFLAPVLMSRLIAAAPLTHDTYELPKAVVVRLLVALALTAWGVDVARGRVGVRWSWWLAPVWLWVGWTGLATAFSASPATSLLGRHGRLDGFVATLTYVVMAFVAMQVFASSNDLVKLVRAVVLSGTVVAGYGVLQALGLDPFYYFATEEFTAGRVFSTLGNPVFLGGLLMLVIPVAVMSGLSEDSRVWRLVAWTTVVLSMVTLLSTATRGAWLAGIAEIVVIAVIVARKKARLGVEGIVAITVGVVSAVAIGIRSLSSGDAVLNVASRFASLGTVDGSSAERLLVAQAALRAIALKPLFGFGPDRFAVAFRLVRPDQHVLIFAANRIDNAHSVPLQIAATAGIVAALAWAVSVTWPLVTLRSSVFSARGGRGHLLVAGLWAAVAGYALFSLVGISVTAANTLLWLMLGVLAGANARVAELRRVWGRAAAVVGAVLVLVCVVWGSMLLAADNSYLLGRMQLHGAATGDPAVSVARAVRLSPLDVTYLRQLPVMGTSLPHQERIADLQRALKLEPGDFDSVIALQQLSVSAGDSAGARTYLERARALAPNDPSLPSATGTATP